MCYDGTMIVAERQVTARRRTRHELADLMAIYECNYLRLRQLIPDHVLADEGGVSCAERALDLHLSVLERTRYTTTIRLTYLFEDELGEFPAPDMRVRIYHDARLAEVIACGRRRGQRSAEYDRMRHQYSLNEKWRMNRFLQKWLGYCLRQGHSYRERQGDRPAPAPAWA